MNEKLPVSATGLEFQSWGPMKQTLEGHASVATIRDQAEANPSERDPESQSSSRIIHREGVAEATCAPELGELCNGAQDFNGGDELARRRLAGCLLCILCAYFGQLSMVHR